MNQTKRLIDRNAQNISTFEDKTSMFSRNFWKQLPSNATSYPRRTSSPPLRKRKSSLRADKCGRTLSFFIQSRMYHTQYARVTCTYDLLSHLYTIGFRYLSYISFSVDSPVCVKLILFRVSFINNFHVMTAVVNCKFT
jgi:hypothetical protein